MDKNLIHNLEENKNQDEKKIKYSVFFVLVILVVIVGGFAGFSLTKIKKTNNQNIGKTVNTEKAIGIKDKKIFKDQAEGILREGGIDGEGNFHLERPGGESQNVYLTSSTVDLSQFVGKKVRVWGETFSAEKAGWLMDVGLVEIIK